MLYAGLAVVSCSEVDGDVVQTDMSSTESANCYIVSAAGTYKFKAVRGNSNEPVGPVAKAEVLWESFGTDMAPSTGDLVKNVTYADGYITFEASKMKGNAVIAAKDVDCNILWSWHIWLTDMPQAQVYNHNACIMMDRNLGATSATPGNVGALGLFYQWGRKDPFLGSSSIHYESTKLAASTISWPSAVKSTSSTGTIDYVTANPTTFVTYNSNNYDWYYTGSSSTDNTRWHSSKTIYDPCPVGWRVPDGGNRGVWYTAGFAAGTTYDSSNEGISFRISSPSTTWYPASGYRYDYDGGLDGVNMVGYYWSVTPYDDRAHSLNFNYNANVNVLGSNNRSFGSSVRCIQE